MNRTRILALAGALALAAGATVHADILVTRDGAQVETRGGWKVDGRRVIFTLPNGTLSSLRSDQVDLDASALATARAAEAARQSDVEAGAATEPAGEPVLRITEKDIPPMANPDLDEEEGGEAAQSSDASRGNAEAAPLEVISWDQGVLPEGAGAEIFGTIRNNGTANVVGPTILAAVYGDDGHLLATTEGSVNQSSIAPGQTANFRASLPGILSFASVKFTPSGRGYATRPPQESEGEEPSYDANPSTGDSEPPADVGNESNADGEPPPAR